MNTTKFALSKTNYIILAIGICIIIAGFLLMMGSASTETHFEPDIFSTRRIMVAPIITLIGFILMIVGILYTPKTEKDA